jgi:two-component system KDP operon response regulator KdpE
VSGPRPPGPIAGRGERILVVEDEPAFAELIALWLERHGWQPSIAPDGAYAIRAFDAAPPDLVVLDLGLPRVDGWHVIRRIRESSSVPIIIVTALGAEADKVRGLASGADDYVTKPLSFPELVARVAAALRRARPPVAADAGGPFLELDGLQIDDLRHRVEVEGREVHLTPTEYRLLRHLAAQPGILLEHGELLAAVWGPAYRDDHHLLRETIRNLRARLAVAAPGHRFIQTQYGLGYRFATDGGATAEDVDTDA